MAPTHMRPLGPVASLLIHSGAVLDTLHSTTTSNGVLHSSAVHSTSERVVPGRVLVGGDCGPGGGAVGWDHLYLAELFAEEGEYTCEREGDYFAQHNLTEHSEVDVYVLDTYTDTASYVDHLAKATARKARVLMVLGDEICESYEGASLYMHNFSLVMRQYAAGRGLFTVGTIVARHICTMHCAGTAVSMPGIATSLQPE